MIIRSAIWSDGPEVLSFFDCHLQGIPHLQMMPELGCPKGVQAAIRKGWLLIAVDKERIRAAIRFYPRKRDGGISIYQFAVEPSYRGRHLINMLLATLNAQITAQCPNSAALNRFYERNGWLLARTDECFNYWLLPMCPQGDEVIKQ